MISVITCSTNPARLEALRQSYTHALGTTPFEFIPITDAASLAEGYNRGAAKATGEILIFTRDDLIEILNPKLPERLTSHLAKYDLIGLAGTSLLSSPNWQSAGYPHLFGQAARYVDEGDIVIFTYATPRPAVGGIQGLEGSWMAARRSVVSKVNFDAATFEGGDLCELDFSFAAHQAGLKVGIACDIHLLSALTSDRPTPMPQSAERFQQKWASRLVRALPRAKSDLGPRRYLGPDRTRHDPTILAQFRQSRHKRDF